LSVAAALIIGTAQLLGLFAVQFGWHGAFWDWVSGLDLNVMGFVIVGLFVLTWLGSMLIWRFGRIEEKWSVQPEC
jgi:high-affinity nickel-transport protein